MKEALELQISWFKFQPSNLLAGCFTQLSEYLLFCKMSIISVLEGPCEGYKKNFYKVSNV